MKKKTLRQRIITGDLINGVIVFEAFTPGVAKIASAIGAMAAARRIKDRVGGGMTAPPGDAEEAPRKRGG